MPAKQRKTAEEKHDVYIGLRLTRAERNQQAGRADKAGMTVSEFMRHAIRCDRITVTYVAQASFPDVAGAVIGLGRTLSGIGNDLNQIARWLNGRNPLDDEIRASVLQIQKDMDAARRQPADIENTVNTKSKGPDRDKKLRLGPFCFSLQVSVSFC